VVERYGDRSRVRRSAQHVLSTFTAWHLLKPLRAGMYVAETPLLIESAPLIGWLMEAHLRSSEHPSAPLSALLTHPAFFPFQLRSLSTGELLRANPRLDAIQQGLHEELIVLAHPR
jgi:hypothetical protein